MLQVKDLKGPYNREIYGISQNPDTKDYIMVLKYHHCEMCGEQYTEHKRCNQCKNWTSGNEKIDDIIKEIQGIRLKKFKSDGIDIWNTTLPEWIPYNQFNEIREIGKDTV